MKFHRAQYSCEQSRCALIKRKSVFFPGVSIMMMIGNDAFPKNVLERLRDENWVRAMGYGKYAGDSRQYEQYVLCLDDETSLCLNNDDGQTLYESAYSGAWMPYLKTVLKRPTLALLEVHIGSTMAAQALHQDWGDTRLFNVIVPLDDDTYGISRAGTTCVHYDGSTVCRPENAMRDLSVNQFAIFPAHVPHHRTASNSPHLCRRVAILQFCELESLGLAWPAIELHRRQHIMAKRKRRPWPQSDHARGKWIDELKEQHS